MRDFICFSVFVCVVVLILMKNHIYYVSKQIDHYPVRLVRHGPKQSAYSEEHGPQRRLPIVKSNPVRHVSNSTDNKFTVIIVTYNEPLLYKTYENSLFLVIGRINNVLTNTDPDYLGEVIFVFLIHCRF